MCDSAHFVRARAITAHCTQAVVKNARKTGRKFTVLPGTVVEIKRTIWQMGPTQVYDGGPDGLAATPGNTLFATQGFFVP